MNAKLFLEIVESNPRSGKENIFSFNPSDV